MIFSIRHFFTFHLIVNDIDFFFSSLSLFSLLEY